jgi:hypothetical protein
MMKRIEFIANLAIVIVASLLATVLIKNYVISKSPTVTTIGTANVSARRDVSALKVDWGQSSQTLVLAISSTCHFCTASSQFYKTLVANKGDTRLIAVMPQSVEEGKKYLDHLGVAVDEVRQLPLNDIGVYGTPSILLVDTSGTVKNFWQGKLPTDKERTVLEALRKERG